MRRVRVKQANPEFAFDLLNLTEQRNQRRSASRIHWLPRPGCGLPQIHSVIRGVLTDQIDFAHTFANERTDFRQDRFRFAAPMLAAHLWDHTKTARMIAALRNLHVSGMRRSKSETRRVVVGNVRGSRVGERKIQILGVNAQRPTVCIERWALSVGRWTFAQNFLNNVSKLCDLIESNKCVHLRQLVTQFSREPLRHAAAYD